MNTVSVGGSQRISRLSGEVKHRLDSVIHSGHRIVVGDANGADKAVQKHLKEAAYDRVAVFCSGNDFRNNLGNWTTHKVEEPNHAKGFEFYAAKDREMAREAEFGLMVWDGKSPGTILNVLRLVRAGKKAVLFWTMEERSLNIKTEADWAAFLSQCDDGLRRDLRARATSDEWQPRYEASSPDAPKQAAHLENVETPSPTPNSSSDSELAASLRAALIATDPAAALEALGGIARAYGMSEVARWTGLSRESLYRALSADGNPEFATVLKVIACLGLRLEISGLPTTGNQMKSSDAYSQVRPSWEQETVNQKSTKGRIRPSRKGKSARKVPIAAPNGLLL